MQLRAGREPQRLAGAEASGLRLRQRHPCRACAGTLSGPADQGSNAKFSWHFAYGANLSAQVLRSRGVPPPEWALLAVAQAGVTLSFQHRGGFATIAFQSDETASRFLAARTAEPGGGDRPAAYSGSTDAADATSADAEAAACSITQPHGMLYRLSDAQLAALVQRETGYRLATILVTPYGREDAVPAKVFVSQRMLRLRRPVPPTQRYLDLVISGAKSCGLSEEYVRQLEGVPTARPGGLPPGYLDTPSAAFAAAVVAGLVILTAALWILPR